MLGGRNLRIHKVARVSMLVVIGVLIRNFSRTVTPLPHSSIMSNATIVAILGTREKAADMRRNGMILSICM